MSQLALNRDHKTPVEGLRKLAASYRNTVRSDKVEVDRMRSGSREKHKLTDPRFRRERTRSPKKASHSRSESQFSTNYDQVNTHSAPTFIAKPLPIPKPEPKHPVVEPKKLEESNQKVSVIMQEKVLDVIEHEEDALVSSSLENQVNSLGKSLLTEEEITNNEPNVIKDNDTTSTTSLNLKKRRNSWGGNRSVKLNYVNKNAYWDDPRLLKKYANLLGGAKRTKSSMTLPFALPKLPDGTCMCMKCSCVKDCRGEYTFDDNTEIDGSNSLLLDPQAVLKEHLNGSYYMTAFYFIGCFCGLVLVAFIAWILSNDTIWNFVNYREVQKKNSILYTAASYVGGAVLFTVNFIFGGIYNIFVLPRNAVFKSSDESWSLWQYIK